jgi:hypothetical protein
MPDNKYPPYPDNSGALTVPRQLIRWLDINPQGGKLNRCQTFITLSPFSVETGFVQKSDIVTSYNYVAPCNFSLKAFNPKKGTNYSLCISWHEDSIVHRYILWECAGSSINQTLPPYTGQTIKKNFRLEVWNAPTTNAQELETLTFYTSKRANIDYRFGTDSALANSSGQVTNFANVNSAIALSNYDLNYNWRYDHGISGYSMNTWSDLLSNKVLSKTGYVFFDATGGWKTGDAVTFSSGNLSGTVTATPYVMAIAFSLTDTSDSIIFSDGADYDLKIVGNRFNAFGGSAEGDTPVSTDVKYLVLFRLSDSMLRIYNIDTGTEIEALLSPVPDPGYSGSFRIGDRCTIPEVATWGNDCIATDAEILSYFVYKYADSVFTLPLTFPSNSTSTPN